MNRTMLALMGVCVAALVAFLIYETRSGDHGPASAKPAASEGGSAAAAGATSAGGPGLSHRMTSSEADASPLPTPEQEAEMRDRVIAERQRPPHMAPEIKDHGLLAKPQRDARDAFHTGDYATALARSQDALAVDPTNSSSRVMAALSACALGKRATAQAHADKLGDLNKWRVAERCQKFGIEIRGATPVDENR